MTRRHAQAPGATERRARARGACARAALAIAAAACSTPSTTPAPSPARADTIWYVSTRARVDGRDSRQRVDSLEYGLAIFTRPVVADPATGPLDLVLADSVQLTAADFAAALGRRVDAASAPQDYAVFYVHGFGTSLHEAWTFAATARARAASDAPWVAFCWPSNGAGIARPTPEEPLSQAYVDDSTAAVESRPAFARALRHVIGGVGAERVVLVPHSMGSQLVGETLASDMPLRSVLGGAPLRAVAFMAPDVEARRFAEYIVPAARPLARRLVLYTSARDRVLEVSGGRSETQRAGHHPEEPLTESGLETVDVTEAVSAGGWLQRTFGNHHALGRATGALRDLAWIVGGGAAADCRLAIGSATRTPDGAWRLTDSLPVPQEVTARCLAEPSRR